MRKSSAVVGSAVFFLLAPGVVAFLIPWLLSQLPVGPFWSGLSALAWAGLALGAAGLAALIDCFARFALVGLGTPAPVAPTRHLVVSGLYRHVRNPMYLAVLAIVLAQALWWASLAIFIYAGLVWLCFTLFVAIYEEPRLRGAHGREYEDCCAHVRRWIPRLVP